VIAAKQAILSIPVLNPGTAKPQTCGISLNFSSFGDGDCNCDRYEQLTPLAFHEKIQKVVCKCRISGKVEMV
jgi:hypothetical protein